jgi:hypothetical protein
MLIISMMLLLHDAAAAAAGFRKWLRPRGCHSSGRQFKLDFCNAITEQYGEDAWPDPSKVQIKLPLTADQADLEPSKIFKEIYNAFKHVLAAGLPIPVVEVGLLLQVMHLVVLRAGDTVTDVLAGKVAQWAQC